MQISNKVASSDLQVHTPTKSKLANFVFACGAGSRTDQSFAVLVQALVVIKLIKMMLSKLGVRYSSTAKVWVDKNTKLVVQGFTGKQVRMTRRLDITMPRCR